MPRPAEVTWLGHATVLLELDGIRILTDPVVRRNVGPLLRIAAPVRPEALRGVDVVLLSHLHADHADPASLRRVGIGVPVVAPAGAADWLRRKGLTDVRELTRAQTISFGELAITAVPAEHDGRRHQLGPTAPAIGFVVRGSRSVYFAGDTDLFPEMADLGVPLDLALLPVSGWGATLGPGHLDPTRAAEATRLIGPRVAIPIHWGTLALPWATRNARSGRTPGQAFAADVARVAPGVEVRVLSPGERTSLA